MSQDVWSRPETAVPIKGLADDHLSLNSNLNFPLQTAMLYNLFLLIMRWFPGLYKKIIHSTVQVVGMGMSQNCKIVWWISSFCHITAQSTSRSSLDYKSGSLKLKPFLSMMPQIEYRPFLVPHLHAFWRIIYFFNSGPLEINSFKQILIHGIIDTRMGWWA